MGVKFQSESNIEVTSAGLTILLESKDYRLSIAKSADHLKRALVEILILFYQPTSMSTDGTPLNRPTDHALW